MEVVCARIELKPGSLPEVRAWASELNSRPDEVIATLAAEGAVLESVFLDRVGETDYLVYYMRAPDLRHAMEVGARLTDSIQAYHNAFKKKTWARVTHLERLIDFSWGPAASTPDE